MSSAVDSLLPFSVRRFLSLWQQAGLEFNSGKSHGCS
jgi:hypothetical protein